MILYSYVAIKIQISYEMLIDRKMKRKVLMNRKIFYTNHSQALINKNKDDIQEKFRKTVEFTRQLKEKLMTKIPNKTYN